LLIGDVLIGVDDAMEWAEEMQGINRQVGLDQVGPFTVSTLFLGQDFALRGQPPRLFETVVFGADGRAVSAIHASDYGGAMGQHRMVLQAMGVALAVRGESKVEQ
jgi:hypothetical protein